MISFERCDCDYAGHNFSAQPQRPVRSAGFLTCCIADFLIGRALENSDAPQVKKPAIQQTGKSALRSVGDASAFDWAKPVADRRSAGGRIQSAWKILSLVAFALLWFVAGLRAAETTPSFLTAEERAWLQSHAAEICVAPEVNYPPFSFVEAGVWRGLSADILRLVEGKLGAKFPILEAQNLDALLSRAQSGAPGIVTSVRETPERSQYLSFTEPYVSLPTAIIVKTGLEHGQWPEAFAGKRVAVGKGYGVQKFLEQNFPGLKLVLVPDDLDGLRQLSFGEIDAVIMDVASASFFIEREKITNLRVLSPFEYRYDLRLAVRKDLPVLREILAKTLRAIPERDRGAVLKQWIQLETDPLPLLWEKYRRYLPLGLTGLALLLGVGATFWILALRRSNAPRNLAAALGVLAVGLFATGVVVSFAKTDAEDDARRKFEFASEEMRLNLAARLRACAQLLHSGAALFDASVSVEREEWRAFVQGLRLEEQLPGIQGVGFAQFIPPAQLAAHVQAIRGEGFPDYEVRPAGEREFYSAIIYIEPFTNRNLRAFGFDMLSEPIRRAAMERARDEHSPALSGKVILVQETGEEVQAGTLMYVPVYRHGLPLTTVEQRRAAFQGWVYSPYRMGDLIRGTLRDWKSQPREQRLDLQVYDGEVVSVETLLFDSRSAGSKAHGASAPVTRLTPVDFAGSRWTLRFTQPGGLAATADYTSAWIAFFGGTIISLLMFGLTVSLQGTRARAERMAERLTKDLRASEESYRNQFAHNSAVMLLLDPTTGAILDANEAAVSFYGYPLDRLLALRITEINTRPAAEVHQALASITPDHGQRFSFQHRLADGSVRDVEVALSHIQFGGRDVLHSIVQDVTERKRAEIALARASAEMRSVLESSGDVIASLDRDYRYTLFNSGFQVEFKRIFGVDLQRGDSLLEALAHVPADLAAAKELWSRALAGEDFTVIQEFGDTALARQWYELHFNPVRDRTGKVVGGVHVVRNITERKRAEELLRESEARYRRLVEGAPDVVYTFSSKRGGIYYSPHVEQVLGYSPEHLYAHPLLWNESIHPEDCGQISAAVREFESGKPFDLEYRIKDSSGNWRWLQDRSIGRQGREDEVLIEGLATDITARKEAELALKESRQLLETAQAFGHVGSWVVDPEPGGPLSWSAETCRLFGFAPGEFDGEAKTFFELIHPDDQERVRQAGRENTARGVSAEVEFRIQRRDGQERWIYQRSDTERDAGGAPLRKVGIVQDITERKQTEAALRNATWRLEGVIEGTNVGTWEWNIPTGETVFNEVWAKILGYTLAELAPVSIKTWEALAHPEDLKQVGELLARHFAGELPYYDCECRMQHKAGHWVWVQDRGCVLTRTSDGKPLMMFGTHADITERKQAETALRAALVEKTALLREVHHRVKNNLQIIRSLLSLQAGQVENEEVQAHLAVTQNRIGAMALLHEHLYRSESLARLNLADYVANLCSHLVRATGGGSSRARLEHHVEPEISIGLDQAVPCGLMINELVTNALKYAFPAGRSGSIRVTFARATPSELRLTVADDGIGLPAGLDPNETQSLGLQLVGMLTQQLGGTVTFTREAGTTVQVLFPLKPDAEIFHE